MFIHTEIFCGQTFWTILEASSGFETFFTLFSDMLETIDLLTEKIMSS